MKNIYKYFGTASLDKVFSLKDHVTVKCSYPKDFNDPYELFLTVDFSEKPELLAYYADAVGNLDQIPTTCFSLAPSVIPMWAHYAQNHEGYAIEFDEESLVEEFPESGFGDVDYRDTADEALTDMLYRAAGTRKPRHTYLLRQGVFSAAYYTKATCWEYEKERRMVVSENETRQISDIILLDIPKKCIKSLVSGPRASSEIVEKLRKNAKELGCRYLQLKIGRSSAQPFFLDEHGNPYIFNGTEIVPTSECCSSCKEPVSAMKNECSWCQINDSHRMEAARANPYRLYAHYGLLDSYIEQMNSVSRTARKK